MHSGECWELLGSLEAEQAYLVLTQLHAHYEERCRHYPDDPAAQAFFQVLTTIVHQVQSCNVKRR